MTILIAYLGPGAGFVYFNWFIWVVLVALAILLIVFTFTSISFLEWLGKKTKTFRQTIVTGILILLVGLGLYVFGLPISLSTEKAPRFVVLGMDGLDPRLVRRMMNEGRMPNFSRLASEGSLRELTVPNIPTSPTSWASFATGTNPGKHGVFGFYPRNPRSYSVDYFSHLEEPSPLYGLPPYLNIPGPYRLPLLPPKIQSAQHGKPFWTILGEHGVPSQVIKVPVTFPPDRVKGRLLSGLGAPDLRGEEGSYTAWIQNKEEFGEVFGGVLKDVNFSQGLARSSFPGPMNTLKDDPEPVKMPISFRCAQSKCEVAVSDQHTFTLNEGTWSNWMTIHFPLGLGFSISGTVRFHLNEASPFFLYMTPIQINPSDPFVPISYPETYSSHLARKFGKYYTMGMAQNALAFTDSVLSHKTFMEQVSQVVKERRQFFSYELIRNQSGLLVTVFDSTDRIQHVMFRHLDQQHPRHNPQAARQYNSVIFNIYEKMDAILGQVIDTVGDDVPIIVLSDHGFQPYRRHVHVNNWLKQNGYLSLREPTPGNAGDLTINKRTIDWRETSAYQLGLTGIYVNLEGREAGGTIPPNKRWTVARSIKEQLETLKDPTTGSPIFKNVYLSKNLYEGPQTEHAPELVLGYNNNYRTSWESALLEASHDKIIRDNRSKWSGTHLVDASRVPGIILTSEPINTNRPNIYDIASTILKHYNVDRPRDLDGQPLF